MNHLLLCALAAAAISTPAMARVPNAAEGPLQGPAGNVAGNEVVHILVGRSVVIRTDPRLSRVLVGNPAVVTTSTTSPNELVVTAAAAGSSSVVIWQENNQSRILEVFADLDVSLLQDAIERGFPEEPVKAEAEEGRVVLIGTASSKPVADQISKMAEPFSKEVVNSIRVAQPGRQKQVLVKVRFAQVDRAKLDQFGINLFSTGATNTFGTIGTNQFGGFTGSNVGAVPKTDTTVTVTGNNLATGAIGNKLPALPASFGLSDLLNLYFFRPDLNLGATIRDLQAKNVLQILAEPNLLSANGEPASFLAGGELPYPLVTGNGTGQSSISVQFKPFGVKLEFTGVIESDDTIRLKVFPEVSSLDYSNAVTINGFILPAIATRHAETVIELKNGQSFSIAGLLDQRTTAQFQKLPGLGDIPILGEFFKSRSINKTNSELIVIVTPTIVDPAAEPLQGPELPKTSIAPLEQKQFDSNIPGANGGK